MGWWGKVIGGGLGYAMGGYIGALLGAAIGHQLDRGMLDTDSDVDYSPGSQARTQTAFFTATFTVLGHIAKSDGRVSEHEIDFARDVMRHFALTESQQRAAMALFAQGKQADFSVDAALAALKAECGRRRHVLQTFFEIQIQAVMADGELHSAERQLLERIGRALGFAAADIQVMLAQMAGEAHFRQARAEHDGEAELRAAYALLAVSPDADEATLKRAYRRQMAQHHPDKLVAQGLPEEMLKEATERSQQIQQAWQVIRQHRGGV